MMALTYDDIKSKVEVVRDYGKYFSAFCPFHSDDTTPSLLVFKDGWFKCLSAMCSRNGNWRMLWDKTNGQNISVRTERRTIMGPPVHVSDVTEELCYQAHIDLQNFSSWQWYMEMRKLDDMTDFAEIGYYRGWYTIPVFDTNHNFVTAVFRAAPHVQEATGLRYWCGHTPVPYSPDWRMVEQSDKIIVVFGMLDALTLSKLRFPVVTTTAGADTFKAEWLDAYRKTIYVIPDDGEEKTGLKLAHDLGWRGSLFLPDYPKNVKDMNDFLTHNKESVLLHTLTEMEMKHADSLEQPKRTPRRKSHVSKKPNWSNAAFSR